MKGERPLGCGAWAVVAILGGSSAWVGADLLGFGLIGAMASLLVGYILGFAYLAFLLANDR